MPMAAPCPPPIIDRSAWHIVEAPSRSFTFELPSRFVPARPRYMGQVARWVDPESRDEVVLDSFGAKDPGAPRIYWGVSHGFFGLQRCREAVAGQQVWLASAWANVYPEGDLLAAIAIFRSPSGEFFRLIGTTEPDGIQQQTEFLASFRTVRF
jgi:hypothetical protein